MSPVEQQDAANVESSSTSEIAPVEVAKGVETISDSPAEKGASPENSPPEGKTGTEQIREIVESAVEPAESETKAEEAAPKGEPEAEVKAEAQETEALSKESQVKVPNEQRPEWQKLTVIGDKLGPAAGKEVRQVLRDIYRKEAGYVKEIEQLRPAGEVVQEMFQSVGGDQTGFRNMRHLIKSFDSDPAGAVPMLETLLHDARKRAGMVQAPELLTEAQDLDKQVAEGMIDHTAADKRKAELVELQKAKVVQAQTAAQKAAERDRQQRTQSEQQTQRAVSEINQAEASWAEAKQKSDPDFTAVQALHGAFAKQNSLDFWNENNRLPTAKESVEILEKSLKMAKAEAGKFRPAPAARKPVTGNSNGSSSQHRQQPKTAREQIEADIQEALTRQ